MYPSATQPRTAIPPSALSGDAVMRRAPQLSKVAWAPTAGMDYAAWVAAGRQLGAIGRGSQWWIGDWLRYGSGQWGEKYVEASKITGYDTGSLRNMASLASQFDLSRRRDNLTWGHHAAVAGLEPAEQDVWLDQATALKLSVADLRIEIRHMRHGPKELANESAKASDVGGAELVCPKCGHAMPSLPRPVSKASTTHEPSRFCGNQEAGETSD